LILLEISSALVFTNGPLLWLYTYTLFKGNTKLSGIHLLHFLPFAVNILVILPYITLNHLAPFSEWTRMLLAWAKLASILFYCLFSIKVINQNMHLDKDFFSNTQIHHVLWLKMVLKLVLGIWIIGFFSQLVFQANLVDIEAVHEDVVLNIAVSILVMVMGYYGFRQAPVFIGEIQLDLKPDKHNPLIAARYQNSAMDKEELQQYAELLDIYVKKEKIYKNPELNLAMLADTINLSTHQISQVINQFYDKNFYEFVNSYRIEEVKQRLLQGDIKKSTMLRIALDAGFNSKATFNRFFKKATGLTPSEFLKEIHQNTKK
jgi:AraC-like DNA-binding protein